MIPRLRWTVFAALWACTPTAEGPAAKDATKACETCFEDADADGVIDAHESATADTDGDGVVDYLDTDADGDGIDDGTEAGDTDPLTIPVDTDGDGAADYLDDDSDDNCIPDVDESPEDHDADGTIAYADLDDDGDGISDGDEIGAACGQPDTDGDGLDDYQDIDSDDDGAADIYEAGTGDEPLDTDRDGTPDYRDLDSDGDGLSDRNETGGGGPAVEPNDTDGDGRYDFQDTDSDGDSLRDDDEVANGTDIYDEDSDDDGYTDGAEVAAGVDPNDAESVIDGLYVVLPERSEVEQAFTFELAIRRGDIVFLLDSTGSMRETVAALAGEFAGIVAALAGTLPDAQYGYGTFNDYGEDPFGVAGSDRTFLMRQQLTDDVDAVQRALTATTAISTGADDPAAAMEALYQGVTGAGYDMDCDGVYSVRTDTLPFIARADDPFGGTAGQFYDASDTSTGTTGGFGFRDYAMPIIVYATDNNLRDPDSTNPVYNGAPGGCPFDAGGDEVVAAVGDLGAYLVAVSAQSEIGVAQMEDLAEQTGSYYAADGDGVVDDKLVFLWEGTDEEFRTTVTGAIEGLVDSVHFNQVSLAVEGDDPGFVIGISPLAHSVSGAVEGETVDFTLTFRGVVAATTEDQIFHLKLNVVGDSTILLDQMDIVILVPGTTY